MNEFLKSQETAAARFMEWEQKQAEAETKREEQRRKEERELEERRRREDRQHEERMMAMIMGAMTQRRPQQQAVSYDQHGHSFANL